MIENIKLGTKVFIRCLISHSKTVTFISSVRAITVEGYPEFTKERIKFKVKLIRMRPEEVIRVNTIDYIKTPNLVERWLVSAEGYVGPEDILIIDTFTKKKCISRNTKHKGKRND